MPNKTLNRTRGARAFCFMLLLSLPGFASTVKCTNAPRDVRVLQSAVNAGGTVTVTGNCATTSTVNINNPVTINGTATLTGNGVMQYGNTMFSINSDNVSVSGLTFRRGNGINITGATHTNLSITYCTFTSTNGTNGIQSDAFLVASTISHNNFSYIAPDAFLTTNCKTWYPALPSPGDGCDKAPGTGIVIFAGIDKTAIEWNNFDNYVIEGAHIAWDGVLRTGQGWLGYYPTTHNSISYNSLRLVHRMGLEIQGNTHYTEGCKNSPPAAPYPPNCSYSLVDSKGTHMAGNYYRSPWQAFFDTYCFSFVDGQEGSYLNNTCVFDAAHGTPSDYGGPGVFQEVDGFSKLYRGNVYIGENITRAATIFQGFLIGGISGTFTAQNNTLAFPTQGKVAPGSACNGTTTFAYSGGNGCPPATATFIENYNYMSTTAPGSGGDLTTPNISLQATSNSLSGDAQTFKYGVVSQLGIRNLTYFLDGGTAAFNTQEISDLSTTFSADRTWLYHVAVATSKLAKGPHTITAVATDVSGYTKSNSQSFAVGGHL